jgi:hypothetical protein
MSHCSLLSVSPQHALKQAAEKMCFCEIADHFGTAKYDQAYK